jgi:hypothetical protein
MERESAGVGAIGTPLAGVLEAAASDGGALVVRFPQPLTRWGGELLETLGVIVEIDPEAPVLSTIRASGRSQKTRRELSDEVRRRMSEAYYARPDKERYAQQRENTIKS